MGELCREPLFSNAAGLGWLVNEGRLHRTGATWDALADKSELMGRQMIEFERTLLSLNKPQGTYVSYTDVLEKYQGKQNKGAVAKVQSLIDSTIPEDIALGKKFTQPFDKRIRQLLPSIKALPEADQRKEWVKTIGKDADTVKNDIIYAGINLKPKEFSAYLNDRYGLKPNQVDSTISWLDWVKEGAHLKPQKVYKPNDWKKWVSSGIANLSASNARMKPTYIIGNAMDMTRIAAAGWKAGPTAPWKVMKALGQTLKEGAFTPNNAVKQADLDTSPDREFKQAKWDPFAATVNFQRNFANKLDIEMGGDGFGLMSSHVFESAPWFAPTSYRDSSKIESQLFGLTRFMVAEAHYTYRTVTNMLGVNGADKILPATAEFLTYQGIKTVMWGVKANIPGPLLELARKVLGADEVNKWVEETDKAAGINWGDNMTQAALNTAFGDNAPKANVSEFFTPAAAATPIVGIMYDKLNQSMDTTPEVAGVLTADNPSQSAVKTLALGMSIANLLPYGGILNNTTFTSLVNGMAESMGDDANDKKTALNLSKAVLGARNVQKGDNN